MPSWIRCLSLIALLCPTASAQVMTVQRCEAADGRITFTSTACKTGERLSLQQVRTYLPGSTTEVYPETAVLPEAEHLQAADRANKAKDGQSAQSRFAEQGWVRQKAKSQTAKSPR
ncbi:hypothetical protein H7995_26715 [Pseudomonas sp. MBT-1]|jgi:hypothetical protein|uniref:DUF4124 domain-containing protein n=1 Tax=Pseudomonas kielensis TaxID=2762577 RepID=A0A7X1GJ89_9PSED|nr:hypothetical protein [Pseudomonas kielensis]NBB36577.1 hypothetical protein [Pseudomonas sp. BC115LW]